MRRTKPAVGISACLLGERVRYDATDRRQEHLLAELEPIVEWVPVCPEVELGLGVPRQKIQLIGRAAVRLITAETHEDITESMRAYAESRVGELAALPISGYVFKSSSPSCGMLGVKVFESAGDFERYRRVGRGLFAAALASRMPDLPIEEEERLSDRHLLRVFRDRVLAYARRLGLLMAWVVALGLAGCGEPGPVSTGPVSSPSLEHRWPMFRGAADHRGDVSAAGRLQWKIRWKVELRERIDASALITADDRVIVATRAGSVVAVSLRHGRIMGRVKLSGGVWSSPALAGDVLVVASSDGVAHGLDWHSLERRWSTKLGSGALSGITVYEGTAYLSSGRRLLGLRVRDGKITLRVPLAAPSFGAPAIGAGARLFVGDRAGYVYAIALGSGRILWRSITTRGADNDGSPVVAGDRVLIGSNDKALHAFGAAQGDRLWRASARGWVVSTPGVHRGVAFAGSDDNHLYAIRLADGATLWRARVRGDVASSPTIVGDWVVHAAHDARLHAHRFDGKPAAKPIALGAAAYASVAVGPGPVVVIGTHRGRLIAVE